jgi:hypothetical protein
MPDQLFKRWEARGVAPGVLANLKRIAKRWEELKR